jgi:uncharacterized protein YjbJ (UPF0337 family)
MGGKTDIVKGRIKEAAGALTGNERLREEGQTDQAVGKMKQAAQTAVAKAKEAGRKTVRSAKETAREIVNKARDVSG